MYTLSLRSHPPEPEKEFRRRKREKAKAQREVKGDKDDTNVLSFLVSLYVGFWFIWFFSCFVIQFVLFPPFNKAHS